jgi:hypothetical protein
MLPGAAQILAAKSQTELLEVSRGAVFLFAGGISELR